MSIAPGRPAPWPWRRCRRCGAWFYRPLDHVDPGGAVFCWECLQGVAPQATA